MVIDLLISSLQASPKGNLAFFKSVMNAKDLTFIENKGQLIDEKGRPLNNILFYGQHRGVKLYFSATKLSFVYTKYNEINKVNSK